MEIKVLLDQKPNKMVKKKFKRVTTSCLCCRKRKLKCNEAKPSCSNCDKSSLVCEWWLPGTNPKNFQPTKTKIKRKKFINVKEEDIIRLTKDSNDKTIRIDNQEMY